MFTGSRPFTRVLYLITDGIIKKSERRGSSFLEDSVRLTHRSRRATAVTTLPTDGLILGCSRGKALTVPSLVQEIPSVALKRIEKKMRAWVGQLQR